MNVVSRSSAAALGRTRVCPHCKTTVLESAAVCPACRHHLRFESGSVQRVATAYSAWKVDGTFAHQPAGEACEYSMVVTLRNEQGQEVGRQVVGVGALKPSERRSFTFSVELTPVKPAPVPPKRS
jgi:hypothetical protein